MGLTLATLHIRQEVPELSRLVKDGETIRRRFKGGANPVVDNGCIYVLDRDITPDEWGFRAKTWNTRIWKLERR